MRINKYLALKKHSTRRGADDLIKKRQVFINGRLAVLGDKVNESDTVNVRFRGEPPHYLYFAYHKPAGAASHFAPEDRTGVFPVSALDKESHGLTILTNDGRLTDRLLSSKYAHEKEYIVVTREKLRSSFKKNMEAGVAIEHEHTEKCRVNILDEDTFSIILTDEKSHQVRRMCVALFQEVKDMKCVRVMNIKLGTLKEGERRKIEGDELKRFLEGLMLL